MDRSLLYTWLIAMAAILPTASLSRRSRNRPSLEPKDIIVIGFALGGIIELSEVFFQLVFTEELSQALGSDGSFALALGLIAGIYLAGQEIIKLF